MPSYQKRGPLYRFQAQGVVWAPPANDNPHRGTIRLFLASAGLIIAVVLAAVAGGAA